MVILTRLLPWILFGIGQALIGPSGAASLAAAGALLLIALSLKTGAPLSSGGWPTLYFVCHKRSTKTITMDL